MTASSVFGYVSLAMLPILLAVVIFAPVGFAAAALIYLTIGMPIHIGILLELQTAEACRGNSK